MEIKQIDLVEMLAVPDDNKLITTTNGLVRAGDLVRRVTEIENDNELTYVIEYFEKPAIHRSVHVQLKQGVAAKSVAASIGLVELFIISVAIVWCLACALPLDALVFCFCCILFFLDISNPYADFLTLRLLPGRTCLILQ